MTNAEIIQAIRNEIEKQRKFIEGMFVEGDNNFYDGQDDAYNNILTFLSTLESEKPMNQDEELNEEIKKFVAEYDYERSEDILLIAIVARHFAEWQKEQDEKEQADLFTIVALDAAQRAKEQQYQKDRAEFAKLKAKEWSDGYDEGITKGKELMMKDAVDAIVEDWNPDPKPEITILLNPEEFTCGDKVRVIILKKED